MSSKPADARPPALEVIDVTKAYRLFRRSSDRLRQLIHGGKRTYYKEHFALRGMTFTVNQGETIGIVGRNGAGKSTLLQIISGTLQPSSGEVRVYGRIAALLELGAGINPVMTGRENVVLLAAVLGLTAKETAERMDEIVAFADLGPYIDQPVKTYSSGMYVRLAFSIATCVDPDILIVDEALSVGDLTFRNKCMARINELRAKGVSILFVSHDLSTLQMICDRAIWIEGGKVRAVGDPVHITQEFHTFMTGENAAHALGNGQLVPQQSTDIAEFVSFRIRPDAAREFVVGDDITFDFALKCKQPVAGVVFTLCVYRRDGQWMIGQTSRDQSKVWPGREAGGLAEGSVTLRNLSLGPGEYVCCATAYSEDLTICYASTELNVTFKVAVPFPTWGNIVHAIEWHDAR